MKNPGQLAEYVAASGPLHCVDGWSYLGRSLAAQASGDFRASLHLAYYAELRAAMALLASEGIGVFNLDHVVIDDRSKPELFPTKAPTHQFVWDALEAWATHSSATELLGRVVKPFGVPINEWYSGDVASFSRWAPIASDWLITLGIDLSSLPKDKDARNEASYRPSYLPRPEAVDAGEMVLFTDSLWGLLEPQPGNAFEYLDRYFLRLTLEESHKASYSDASTVTLTDYVESSISAAVGDGSGDASLGPFLRREIAPDDPLIFRLAKIKPDESTSRRHADVIGRAMMLLRFASGSWKDLFEQAEIPSDQLAFDWVHCGRARGLWMPEEKQEGCLDLWAEVRDARSDLNVWFDSVPTDEHSQGDVIRSCARPLAILTGLERVALWGFAS